MTPRPTVPVGIAVLLVSLSACGEDGSPPVGVGGNWQAARDTIGDTVVVRTVAGSVWGDTARLLEELRIGRVDGPPEETFGRIVALAEGPGGTLYVADGQVPAVRAYGPDGVYLRTLGGQGEGPGEYGGLNGANMLATLPDGRVLLRDPSNGRINVYGPGGEARASWRIRAGRFTMAPLYTDTAGYLYHPIYELTAEGTDYRLVRFSPAGERMDTLSVDHWSFDAPILEATSQRGRGRASSQWEVPFSPRVAWTFSPLGSLVGGVSARYAVELLRRDAPVLRIEREVEPVFVQPAERKAARERIVSAARRMDPDWRWDGPPIPDTKPPFRSLWADADGRVWVRRSTPAVRESQKRRSTNGGSRKEPPPERWREPYIYDVFEPDGRYLGPVRLPEGMRASPRPVARGDTVWAVLRGPMDVPVVARFRLTHGDGGEG